MYQLELKNNDIRTKKLKKNYNYDYVQLKPHILSLLQFQSIKILWIYFYNIRKKKLKDEFPKSY